MFLFKTGATLKGCILLYFMFLFKSENKQQKALKFSQTWDKAKFDKQNSDEVFNILCYCINTIQMNAKLGTMLKEEFYSFF